MAITPWEAVGFQVIFRNDKSNQGKFLCCWDIRKLKQIISFVSGIYFKYDISAFKVIVNQDRESIWQFLLKLCSGVGGIFATSQILCDLLRNVISFCVDKSKNQSNDDVLLPSAPS